jgi:4-hydroxybenzoate polyprenyltransferase
MNSATDESDSQSTLQSYLELLRLPNVFTAVADVAMGFFFVQASWAFDDQTRPPSLLPLGSWTLGLLVAASCSLYLAGMVLNDLFDVEVDREEQPYRPLPSGRISLAAARLLGWNLLSAGVMLAAAVAILLERFPPARVDSFALSWRPALVAAALAVLIVLYNAWLKRTPVGPVAMGGCRTLNVLLGMSVLRDDWRIEHWGVAAAVGVYIAGVTWFARDDARRSDRRQLVAAALVMLAGVGLLGALPWLSKGMMDTLLLHTQSWQWEVLIAALAGFVIARTAPAIVQPSPGPVRAAVGRSIMALIFLDAAACFAAAGPTYAIWIAALVLPTVVLSRLVQS